MRSNIGDVEKALTQMGYEVMYGKGGFWIRGQGHISLAKARKMTGVEAPRTDRRSRSTDALYGDYAWLAAMNGAKLRGAGKSRR